MHFAIRVESLGKCYRLGLTHAGSIRELVNRSTRRLLGRKESPLPHDLNGAATRVAEHGKKFWALRDVSFDVQPGEVVGLIGHNGAGKSTLLKILSRITAPSAGRVEMRGRISSLLEVGTGFHPELTGRENVFLNGAILGMTKAEIRRKFDAIVDFAEIAQFIDTPVKRYSSGMYVRLAFAVAAHLEPEILVIDEVLAVGDAAFQKKCLGKMGDVAKLGRTILFVSHNMAAVRSLCGRAIWLDGGRARQDGPSGDLVELYLRESSAGRDGLDVRQAIEALPRDPVFRLRSIAVRQEGREGTNVVTGKQIEILIEYDVYKGTDGLHVYFEVRDQDGLLLFESLHNGHIEGLPRVEAGRYVSRATIPADFLAPLLYELRFLAGIHYVRGLLPQPICIPLNVEASGRVNQAYPGYKTPGRLAPLLAWETTREGDPECHRLASQPL
jgi:lipopolysaccharide transport system ATP-binding protein